MVRRIAWGFMLACALACAKQSEIPPQVTAPSPPVVAPAPEAVTPVNWVFVAYEPVAPLFPSERPVTGVEITCVRGTCHLGAPTPAERTLVPPSLQTSQADERTARIRSQLRACGVAFRDPVESELALAGRGLDPLSKGGIAMVTTVDPGMPAGTRDPDRVGGQDPSPGTPPSSTVTIDAGGRRYTVSEFVGEAQVLEWFGTRPTAYSLTPLRRNDWREHLPELAAVLDAPRLPDARTAKALLDAWPTFTARDAVEAQLLAYDRVAIALAVDRATGVAALEQLHSVVDPGLLTSVFPNARAVLHGVELAARSELLRAPACGGKSESERTNSPP